MLKNTKNKNNKKNKKKEDPKYTLVDCKKRSCYWAFFSSSDFTVGWIKHANVHSFIVEKIQDCIRGVVIFKKQVRRSLMYNTVSNIFWYCPVTSLEEGLITIEIENFYMKLLFCYGPMFETPWFKMYTYEVHYETKIVDEEALKVIFNK